jgi:hypothetical protein
VGHSRVRYVEGKSEVRGLRRIRGRVMGVWAIA